MEMPRLIDQFDRVWDGDPWHGHPLKKIIDGVTAEKAAARPIPNGHSIWEIVLHVAAWEGAVARRLDTGVVDLPEEGDWPEIAQTDPQSWKDTLRHLEEVHESLRRSLGRLSDARLEERLGGERNLETGGGVSVATTVHGIIAHSAYHAGQIAMLKNA
ncbi:MAG: DinB family protein [Acidobacteriota bacterium]